MKPKKSYNIDLSDSGIEELKNGLNDYLEWIEERSEELCKRLADMGAVSASLEFSRAIYSGDEDHVITVEKVDNNCYKVKASGETVLFVEFGTGLIGYGHPEPHEMGPGTYPGKGHWNDPNGWYYGSKQHTYGNPPNMPMYHTVKELELELERVAREVLEL